MFKDARAIYLKMLKHARMHLPICLNIGKGLVLPLAKLNHYQRSNMFKDARANMSINGERQHEKNSTSINVNTRKSAHTQKKWKSLQ